MSVWCHFGDSAFLFFRFGVRQLCVEPFLDGKKANAEHKRGLGHADSLLQSLLIQAPVVTPYTASSPHSIMTTRHFRHDTTLSCLLLDADSDAVALHDGNLTEELSHAAAIC